MSLMGRLASWITPALKPVPLIVPDLERQQRESEVLLRQLRAELQLMRRWREREGDQRIAPQHE